MKKIITALFAVCMLTIAVFAGENNETLQPVLSVLDTDAITIYCVGGATTSAATCQVFVGSMSVTTADGLYPGTTWFVFSDTAIDTIGEFISFLNSVSATTTGAEGGFVATLPNGAYDGNPTAELAATVSQSIKGSAAAKTLTVTRMLGTSYILPASGLRWKQQYHITGLSANATYTTGTVTLNVYNGATTASTNLLRYKLNATTTETPIALPASGDFAGSNETAMRFDVIGSSWVTAGHMNIIGHKK